MYGAIEAERTLNNLYSSAFGFNGGEGLESFQANLLEVMNPSQKPKKDYGDEETLEQWDKFLATSGL
jgi:hypothetical protein